MAQKFDVISELYDRACLEIITDPVKYARSVLLLAVFTPIILGMILAVLSVEIQ